MSSTSDYHADPQFWALGDAFSDAVEPARFPQHRLRYRNQNAAHQVGLGGLSEPEWLAHFGRFEPLPYQPGPVAMRYHGHQFRTYNPELGDGRGFLLAQLRDQQGRLLDLATKGSGTTPWSRSGDGRLTLKGGVREVLAAEMLQALGVKTSRAFSLIETGEALDRGDEPSPTRSAVLVRLGHSHLRFGTFQRAAYFERADQVDLLVEHTRRLYWSEVEAGDVPGLLRAVVGASAELTAQWVAAGFVHGVLNTDNLNVTGESFDYGPWRFLPWYEPGFTAAYFDQTGLYAFARQPEAVFWALTQFAGTLKLIADVGPLTDALNGFGPAYIAALRAAFLRRLGVGSLGEVADQRLLDTTLALLREGGAALRWEPLFFDWFGGFASSARALAGPRRELYQSKMFADFRFALFEHEPDRPERLEHPAFAASEPQEMLIDEVEAIWACIDQDDDWSPFEQKLEAVRAAADAYR